MHQRDVKLITLGQSGPAALFYDGATDTTKQITLAAAM